MGGKLGTKEESEKVIELYEKGLSNIQISNQIGRSEYFVRTRVERYQKYCEAYVPTLPNEDELVEQIIKMHKEGLSPRKIAYKIDKSYDYVRNRIKRYKDNIFYESLRGE